MYKNILNFSFSPLGQSYRSDKQASTFCHFIADVERLETKQLFLKAQHVSLIIDGSTDSSVTEVELCYLRLSVEGQVHHRLLAMCNPGKADAEGITRAVISATIEQLELETEGMQYEII